jgi:hypothetical protein
MSPRERATQPEPRKNQHTMSSIASLIQSGDLKITSQADFKATTVTVEPATKKGEEEFAKMFSPFAVSAEIRKSSAIFN